MKELPNWGRWGPVTLRVAETSFPARPIAVKKLDRVITLLLGGAIQS
jgi:hypothetical protein